MTDDKTGRARNAAFAVYLRTGRRLVTPSEGVTEIKFNPWHDPEDGRFTFAGRGRYYGAGTGSARDDPGFARRPNAERARRLDNARPSARPDHDLRKELENPVNAPIYIVRPGDSLSRVAANRKGLSVSDLAWINGIPIDGVLRVGQKLKVPTQAWLDSNKVRHDQTMRAVFYVAMGGKLPVPNSADDKMPQVDLTKLPSVEAQITSQRTLFSKNGYTFIGNELLMRPHTAKGKLNFGTTAARSKRIQARAGGPDRRATDHGGHLIAARFNGPAEWYNHFAQDANFNNSAFKKLEIQWDRAGAAGSTVEVELNVHYQAFSRRPYELEAKWQVDGKAFFKIFPNESGGE